MKKQVQKAGVLIVLFLLSIQLISAQKADTSMFHPTNSMYDRYMARHATFNTVGWVLMAPGASMVIIGVLDFKDFNTGTTLFGVGAVLALTSIPFFVIGRNNAHRARLQLKSGNVPGAAGFNYAALSLSIHL